ncbi:MAG: serine hydrolase domain-containing protein [Sphingopyxis sp.]
MNRKNDPLATRARRATPAMMVARTAALAAFMLPMLAACGDAPPPVVDPPHIVQSHGLIPPARAVIGNLFNDAEAMGETRALMVLKDGEPVYEAYGEGFGPQSKLISWSMAKSITSVMVGMLVADGRLVLDDPAPVPAWQRPGDPRGTITLRHLLHMASGLDHVESGNPVWESDTVAMLFGNGAQDMAGMAEAKPPIAQTDERFNYSTATTVILSDIIARALTESDVPAVRRDAVRNYLDGRLAGPLGMTSLTPEFDARGTLIGGSMMHATARDYAKFGEFLRRRGVAATGTRLMPDSWFDFMLAPSPANPAYGGHIWLNNNPAEGDAPLWPGRGPHDVFACIGHQGQYIIVSPSAKLTIVRLGISTDGAQGPNVRDALAKLSDLM